MGTSETTGASLERRDHERQYRALTERTAFRARPDRMLVEISGADRISFMQGLCSNDVKAVATGALDYFLLLTEHAHVISDFYLFASEKTLLMEIDRQLWPRSLDHLNRFLVADDVEFREVEPVTLIEVAGPESAETIRRAVDLKAVPELKCFSESAEATVAQVPRYGRVSSFTAAVLNDKADELIARLRDNAVEADDDSFEIIRVENGIARVGRDTGEKTIALEARLEAGISFRKGCYLGQETIERATARGALKKRLYGVRLQKSRMPERNSRMTLDGKEVGRMTSVVESMRLGPIGLGIVHHSAWNPGASIEVVDESGSVGAAISELPFA